MDVIKNPESTKKISTPTHPMDVRLVIKYKAGC